MTEQILAVQRMQDYIDAHLDEKISPAELAEAALYSPWYSYRLFAEVILGAYATLADDLAGGLRDDLNKDAVRVFHFGTILSECSEFCTVGDKQRDGDGAAFVIAGAYAELTDEGSGEAVCAAEAEVWGEPVCLWLPERYRKPGTSKYVQGVEAPFDFDGSIPDGFDVIKLPETQYMMFQGEPFAEEDYSDAINAVQNAMNGYDPSVVGYVWNDDEPRIQLEPRGSRGYIELRAVKKK